MDPIIKYLNSIAYKFPKGYPDMNDPKDKTMLFELVKNLIEQEEISTAKLKAKLLKLVDETDDENELKQIARYARDISLKNSMKPYLSSKNLSSKDILFFQSLLDELDKVSEFSTIANNAPTFNLDSKNYFDQIPSFTPEELKSLYGDMKDSIQGTVSLGPGEAFLSVFFDNVKKANAKGDLNIDGKEVELKSRTGASGAMVAPKYVVRGKGEDIWKDLAKLVDKFDLDNDQKEELKKIALIKGQRGFTWPFKINSIYQQALNMGEDQKKLTKLFSDEISSWYKNKLPLDFNKYFINDEFEAKRFIGDLAKQLARDYFEEHKFDGMMFSNNVGDFKYYEGDDFIEDIGNTIIISAPSDLVPRLKIK